MSFNLGVSWPKSQPEPCKYEKEHDVYTIYLRRYVQTLEISPLDVFISSSLPD